VDVWYEGRVLEFFHGLDETIAKSALECSIRRHEYKHVPLEQRRVFLDEQFRSERWMAASVSNSSHGNIEYAHRFDSWVVCLQ
jgi:hypothetical protein